MPTVLNLSNEVVKMRSEVKKVKVFIIRKLTRQMTMLKKKKGKEEDVQRNQRRAARLLEEIHELKVLAPDTVTKTALQKDINFEKVCQNPQASITDRAVARIATHPQFSQKIQSIKDRIEAFKDERIGTSSKKEKKRKSDINEKEAEDVQATAGDVKKVTEEEDGNDTPPSESCVTVTDESTAPQTNSENEAASAVQTSPDGEKVPEEVVRMRKEVKKIRVLIISKLTNQIEVLKRKKGEPSEVEDNKQKTASLLKEIQVLRSIKPDHVTKAALQENANLENVCEDPDANPLDRATARVITHPRFIKKLQAVRGAIAEEKRKAAEAEEKKKRRLEQASLSGEDSDNEEEGEYNEDQEQGEEDEDESGDETEDDDDDDDDIETGDSEAGVEEEEEEEEEMLNERPNTSTSQVAEVVLKVSDKPVSIKPTTTPTKKQVTVKGKPEGHSVTVVNQESTLNISSTVDSSIKHDGAKPLKKVLTASPAPKNKPISKPTSKTLVSKEKAKEMEDADSESELDLSDDEEKPYFDDSTEERFHKQSSMSEESDDDDFFIGKVNKFKKKKKNLATGDEKTKDVKNNADQDNMQDHKQEEKETTNRSDFKPSKFESVFCTALSRSSNASLRPRDRFCAKPLSRFQKPGRQPEGDSNTSWEKEQNQNLASNRKTGSSFHNQKRDSSSNWGRKEKGPFGTGNGRQPFDHRQNQSRSQRPPPGKNFKSSRQASEALHPSWEASRKRKEQTSQIAAFQGKKIKFDDDD